MALLNFSLYKLLIWVVTECTQKKISTNFSILKTIAHLALQAILANANSENPFFCYSLAPQFCIRLKL